MSDSPSCPECGSPLPPQPPGGACPRCLMRIGLPPEAEAGDRGRTPPSLEEVAARFPALELLEVVGQGGMGVVYRARQVALDRVVALKILWPDLGTEQAFSERFTREARALAKLDHANIVRVHEFGSSGEWFYLVMEYVDGSNLRALMDRGEIPPAAALAIVPQICDALQYAHDRGVVHRDVKPANVLLDLEGRVKLVDFGLAKLLATSGVDTQLTQTDQVMGTLHYMAPEQYRTPHDIDHRADIYSLGVVFYEMLTGELPVGRFEPPSQRVQVDVRLDEIVLRSLEREREKRYQRAGDVSSEVTRVASQPAGEGPAAQRPSAARAHGRPLWPRLLAAALLVVLLGIAAQAMLRGSSGGPGTGPDEADLPPSDGAGPPAETAALHVSGGPAGMAEGDKQREARRIVAAWGALLRRLRTRSAMDMVRAEGEYVYGPDGMAALGGRTAADLERSLRGNPGSLGVPLLREPLGLPPLSSYRVVAVRFVDGPAHAKVAVEAGRRRMWFRMHQHQGSWYFDVAAVWRSQLPDPSGRVDVKPVAGAPPPSQAEVDAVAAMWERLRGIAQDEPVLWEEALVLYTPEDREALARLGAEERAEAIRARKAGAPLLRTEAGAPALAAHRAWSVTFTAPDVAKLRAGFREQWTLSLIDATLRKVGGAWGFTREAGYAPPKEW